MQLARYGGSLVEDALTEWQRTSVKFPLIADIVKLCDEAEMRVKALASPHGWGNDNIWKAESFRRDFSQAFTDEFGEPCRYSYLMRSVLTETPGGMVLHAWSSVADRWFRDNAKKFLSGHGVRQGARLPPIGPSYSEAK